MKTYHLPLLTALGLLLACGSVAPAQTTSLKLVTRFDYPGGVFTVAQGINDAGDVVGYFTSNPNGSGLTGFVRYAGGTFSAPLIYPDSNVTQTILTAINNSGIFAGYYSTDPPVATHSFFLTGGAYTTYDYPGAYDTRITGINDQGDFVGTYMLTDNTKGAFAVIGGVLKSVTIPDATYVSASDINNDGDIVGWYNTPDASLAFRLESSGRLRAPIKPPMARASEFFGTNDTTTSVGISYDGSFNHGLLFTGGHEFITYDLPTTNYNALTGINRRGLICGFGFDGSGTHSYLLRARTTSADQTAASHPGRRDP